MCFFFPISVWGKAVDFCNSRSPSSVRPDRSVTHTHNSFTHSPFTHNSYNIATHTHTHLLGMAFRIGEVECIRHAKTTNQKNKMKHTY